MSAGRHDLGNAGRHTWGKDSNADPSHTDPLTIFKHPAKDWWSGSAIHHECNKRVFFWIPNCVNREWATVQGALCWWGTSCGRALFTASTYVDSCGWQINQLQTYLECYSFKFAFFKLLSPSRTLVTFLWLLCVLTTYFPPELRAHAPLGTLMRELSWCTAKRKCHLCLVSRVTPQLSRRKSVVNRKKPGGQRHICRIKLNSTNKQPNQPVRLCSAPLRFDWAPPINTNRDRPSHSFTSSTSATLSFSALFVGPCVWTCWVLFPLIHLSRHLQRKEDRFHHTNWSTDISVLWVHWSNLISFPLVSVTESKPHKDPARGPRKD